MELLLCLLRSAHILHRAGSGEEGYAVHTAGCVLVGQAGLVVRRELWYHAFQQAVAGVRKGGQAMGRHRLDGHQSGIIDGICGGAIGVVDMLSAEQRREERGVEEVVLDDCPGHRGDIRR